ncbi:phospholipase-like protein [Tanacetum coccineum]
MHSCNWSNTVEKPRGSQGLARPHVKRVMPKAQIVKKRIINFSNADYKPPLETVFAANIRSKKKKCGLQKKYVLRSVQERKKKLAMALSSLYGQLGTTTPAPPKTRSMTSIGDTIVAPEFEVNLSRPDGCKKDKVYIPVNEPQKHWCLAELQISTGVVTFYDTLGWVKGNRRPWWRNMKRNLPQQLTSYLNEHGVLASKGISVERYEIKYAFPNVVRQADESGDCGVWVCIFLYRLSRKQPLTFKDPIQTVLAYRETMLQYFWNHKFAAPKAVLMDEGTFISLRYITLASLR